MISIMAGASAATRTTAAYTYYLLRVGTGAHGKRTYVGLAPAGAHAVVMEALQARRFSSRQAAASYAGVMSATYGEFEIEARIAD